MLFHTSYLWLLALPLGLAAPSAGQYSTTKPPPAYKTTAPPSYTTPNFCVANSKYLSTMKQCPTASTYCISYLTITTKTTTTTKTISGATSAKEITITPTPIVVTTTELDVIGGVALSGAATITSTVPPPLVTATTTTTITVTFRCSEPIATTSFPVKRTAATKSVARPPSIPSSWSYGQVLNACSCLSIPIPTTTVTTTKTLPGTVVPYTTILPPVTHTVTVTSVSQYFSYIPSTTLTVTVTGKTASTTLVTTTLTASVGIC